VEVATRLKTTQPGVDQALATGTCGSSDANRLEIHEVAVLEEIPGVTLTRLLGRGGNASVYLGRHDGVDYAIKLVDDDTDPQVVDAFRREAAVLASLTGADVPQVHCVGQVGNRPYLIMEFIQGRSLRILVDEGPLPPSTVADLGARLATTLGVAHRAGLVHRDLKPENVIVRPDGSACLVDFGLTCRTGTGSTGAGSYVYSAPEQTGMLNLPVDGRSDLFALGVLLFEALAGRPPYQASDTAQLIQGHLTQPVPELRPWCPDVPASLEAIVRRLLAKDPDDRYQDADTVAAGLRAVSGGTPSSPQRQPSRSSRPAGGLVGRESHWRILTDRLARARRGEGGTVLVTGGAGVGRSRLVQELAAEAQRTGYLVISGECRPEDGRPFAYLRSALDGFLVTLERGDPDTRTAVLAHVAVAVGDNPAPVARLGPGIARAMAQAGIPIVPEEETGPGDDIRSEERWLDSVVRLVGRLLDYPGGGLLVVDDVHRADAETRRVLQRLAAGAATTRRLIVVTTRETESALTEELVPDLRLPVTELLPGEVAPLVRERLGGREVSPDVLECFAHRCAGNPLRIVELLRAMLDAGLLAPDWGHWRLDVERLDDLHLSDDLTDLLLQRTSCLTPTGRDVLTIAAAVGTRFDPELVGAVAVARGTTPADAMAAIGDALGLRLVEPHGRRYRFVHHRVRTALLEHLPDPERQTVHAHLARLLTGRFDDPVAPEQVYEAAEQVLAAGDRLEPAIAVDVLVRAGAAAVQEHSGDLALDHLRQAQRIADAAGLSLGSEVLSLFGLAAAMTTDHSLADHYLAHAAGSTTDPLLRAGLLRQRAVARQLQWQADQARELVEQAFHELGHPLPPSRGRRVLDTAEALVTLAVRTLVPVAHRPARGREAELLGLLSHLSVTGRHSASISHQLADLVTFTIRQLRYSTALGAADRALAVSALSALLAVGGQTRVARRLGERARRMDDGVDRAKTAELELTLAISQLVAAPTGEELGESTEAVLDRHGPHLSSADHLGAASLQLSALLVHGWTRPAERVARRVQLHVAGVSGLLGHAYVCQLVHLEALTGRYEDAAARLNQVHDFLMDGHVDLSQRLNTILATLVVAVESGSHSADVESACSRLARLGIDPRRTGPLVRPIWLYQAWARLDQLAMTGIGTPLRRGAETRAVQAVTDLRRAVDGRLLRAHHQVCRARLDHLIGRGRRGTARLRALEDTAAALGSPLLDFEIARARATGRLAAGQQMVAFGHLSQALALAHEHGWRGRESWARREIGRLETGHRETRRSTGTTPGDRTVNGSWAVPESPSRTNLPHRAPSRQASIVDIRRQSRMEAIQQVSLEATQLLDPAEMASRTTAQAASLFGAERAILYLCDADTGALAPFLGRTASGQDSGDLDGAESALVERVAHSREPLVISGPEEAKALGLHSAAGRGVRSAMVAPMSMGGRLVGVMYLDSRVARGVFTRSDTDALVVLTNQVALGLETARAAQLELAVLAATRERDLAETFRAAIARMSASLDPAVVVQELTRTVQDLLPADRAVLVDAAEWPVDDPRSAALFDLRVPYLPASGQDPPAVLGSGIRTWLAAPLTRRDRTCAVLLAGSNSSDSYTDAQAQVVAAVGEQGIVALEHARLHQRIEKQAMRDALTGLANRRSFLSAAEPACEQGPEVAAVMVDIDRFKSVNDRYGHGVGDDVIQEVATRLASAVRGTDLICRWGGEEFAVLLPHTDDQQARKIAGRLHDVVSERPVDTSSGPLRITVSIGLAAPGAEEPLSALLRRADQALYESKNNGRDRVTVAAGSLALAEPAMTAPDT
jgi:diguanylate cyclase (GGDEF)-like protein